MSEYYDKSCRHFYSGAPDYYEQCRFYGGPNHYPGYTYGGQYQGYYGETSVDRQKDQAQETDQACLADTSVAEFLRASRQRLSDDILDINSEESYSGCSEESEDTSVQAQAAANSAAPQVGIVNTKSTIK